MINPGDIVRYKDKEVKVLLVQEDKNSQILITQDSGWALDSYHINELKKIQEFNIIDNFIDYLNSNVWWVNFVDIYYPFKTEIVCRNEIIEERYFNMKINFDDFLGSKIVVYDRLGNSSKMIINEISGDFRTIYADFI